MINSYHDGDESQTQETDTFGQSPGQSRALSLYSTGNLQVASALRRNDELPARFILYTIE